MSTTIDHPTIDTRLPPSGYPEHEWSEDPFWAVAPELRADYLAAASRGVGNAKAYGALGDPGLLWPREDGGQEWREASFEQWAHVQRRDAALKAVDARRRNAAATEADTRTCVSCGTAGLTRHGFQLVQAGPVSAWACRACAPLLMVELTAQATVGSDGRTRGELARDAATRLLHGRSGS